MSVLLLPSKITIVEGHGLKVHRIPVRVPGRPTQQWSFSSIKTSILLEIEFRDTAGSKAVEEVNAREATVLETQGEPAKSDSVEVMSRFHLKMPLATA